MQRFKNNEELLLEFIILLLLIDIRRVIHVDKATILSES